jgi:hypothetical protein
MAVRLCKVFGGSAESWLVQQAQYDLAHVRATGVGHFYRTVQLFFRSQVEVTDCELLPEIERCTGDSTPHAAHDIISTNA